MCAKATDPFASLPETEKYSLFRMMPPQFVYHLGIYVQTCAHIEMFASALATSLEIADVSSAEWMPRYAENRKLNTNCLIGKLRKASQLPRASGFSSDLAQLCDWMHQFKNNRHTAVHGAFLGRPNGTLRVDFIQKSNRKDKAKLHRTEAEITKSSVIEALDDADRILRLLSDMLNSIEAGMFGVIIEIVMPHAFDVETGGWA